MKSSGTNCLDIYSVYFTTVPVDVTEPLVLLLIQLPSNAGHQQFDAKQQLNCLERNNEDDWATRGYDGETSLSWMDGWMEGPIGSFQHSSTASLGLTAIVWGEESYQWICARLGLPTIPSAPSCFATGILLGRGWGWRWRWVKKGTLLHKADTTAV